MGMDKYNIVELDGKEYVAPRDIEYKMVDKNQFISCGYDVIQSDVVPDKEGYVTTDLLTKIDITKKSTDVINVATGSGKTTAIYQLIKKILSEDNKSVIIMSSPFIALVEKDMRELTSDKYGIDGGIITNYRHLNEEINKNDDIKFSFVDKILTQYIDNQRIHITTINALLRNPGDTAFEQKIFKTNYFVNLLDFCEKRELRVYMFFDEIHASIHNFKNEFIHYLTMWKKVVHKCIVSTATYTEPVNIVIKHLAYLTDDNIHILESNRVKRTDVSPLDMVFFPEEYSLKKNKDLIQYLQIWINGYILPDTHFHMICYSKKLAKIIYDELEGLYPNTQLLTSETKKKDVVFNQTKNNIGTNFSTGVDITNPGDLLVVIFPCKYSDELIKGEEGIFYDGLPTILQSVARLRTKGRILFTIPPLKAMIKSDMCEKLLKNIPYFTYDGYISRYNLPNMHEEQFLKYDYHILKSHLKKKTNFVNNKIYDYESKIAEINNERKNKQKPEVVRPKIQFPEESTFILEKGQEYLKYISFKSGKFITPYVVWAALHDQYINCTLDKIVYLDRNVIFIEFETGKISMQLMNYYMNHNKGAHILNFKDYFAVIKKQLTTIDIIDKKSGLTKQNKVHLKLDGINISIFKLIIKNDFYFAMVDCYFKLFYPKIAVEITDRKSYLKFALAHANSYNSAAGTFYNKLNSIIDGFIQHHQGNRYNLTQIVALPYFSDLVIHSILDIIGTIKEVDEIINVQTNELNGSFWNFKKRTKIAVVGNFVTTFITKTNRDKINSYLITDRI